jgi:hypothetical protein
MARKYEVEGTKDFLYWSIGLIVLSLWGLRDGWFPTEATQIKHEIGDPDDGYYLFNKTLAIGSFIGALVCGVIHKFVK